jgi:hypothetical protein
MVPSSGPWRINRTGTLERPLDPGSVYRNIVMKYAKATGVSTEAIGVCVHSMRRDSRLDRAQEQGGYCEGAGMAGA